MKKHALFLSGLIVAASSVFAVTGSSKGQKAGTGVAQQKGQMQMANPTQDCSTMSIDEQDFANQMTDMNNKTLFCSQFTPQQRQQAMQMMGQPDASGNAMSADQAVQQVMQAGSIPSTQRRSKGCPVK